MFTFSLLLIDKLSSHPVTLKIAQSSCPTRPKLGEKNQVKEMLQTCQRRPDKEVFMHEQSLILSSQSSYSYSSRERGGAQKDASSIKKFFFLRCWDCDCCWRKPIWFPRPTSLFLSLSLSLSLCPVYPLAFLSQPCYLFVSELRSFALLNPSYISL